MKKVITLVLALLLTLTACTSATPANSPSASSPSVGAAQTPEAVDTARTVRIAQTEGDSATMRKGGNQFTAKEGLTLGGGDAAITGASSYIYLNLNSRSVLIMDEKSRVEVERISEKSLSLTLVEGAISADITRENADDTYAIRAGNTTLGIRGTRFVVEYRGGDLAIFMLEGSGEVEGVLLTEGHVARVIDGEVVVEPFDPGGAYGAFVEAAITGGEIGSGGSDTPSDNNGGGEHDVIQFAGIEWLVLDVKDGKTLILSDKVLTERAYNSEGSTTGLWAEAVTWAESDIRQYLNGEFYESTFSADEKARIAETALSNKPNQWYGTEGGADTTDKVFLLSIEEVVKYFGDSGQLANRPVNEGLDAYFIHDEYSPARIAVSQDTGEAAHWWLRSPGGSSNRAAFVGKYGRIYITDDAFVNYIFGVRPAMWITL